MYVPWGLLATFAFVDDVCAVLDSQPAKHLPLLLKEHEVYPELWRHFPVPSSAVENLDSLTKWYAEVVEAEPSRCLWAVYDVESDDFAGAVGLLNTSVENKTTEIGYASSSFLLLQAVTQTSNIAT